MEQEMWEVEELFMMGIKKKSRIELRGKKQTMTSLPYYLAKAYQTPW